MQIIRDKYGIDHNLEKIWCVEWQVKETRNSDRWSIYNKYKSYNALSTAMNDITRQHGPLHDFIYRPCKIEYTIKKDDTEFYHNRSNVEINIITHDITDMYQREQKIKRILK